MNNQKKLIEKFLQLKRFALVGVSSRKKDFSRMLWTEFISRGYEVIPVHPAQKEIDGIPCYAHVKEITPPAAGALIMVSKEKISRIIHDCALSGIRLVWVYGIRGEKDVDKYIIELCHHYDIEVIAGHCPYMFLNNTSFIHRLHTFGWKMIGYYPK